MHIQAVKSALEDARNALDQAIQELSKERPDVEIVADRMSTGSECYNEAREHLKFHLGRNVLRDDG